MNPTEVVMLTGYLRAHFPSQPVDEYTTEALGELLAPYPAADCRLAVLRIAERGEKWCAPTEVRAEVKRIRSKRIADAGDLTPPPDLTPLETIAWLKDSRRRIGDGEQVDALAAYGELKPRNMPDLMRALPAPSDAHQPSTEQGAEA
jgi:hypothetical protein